MVCEIAGLALCSPTPSIHPKQAGGGGVWRPPVAPLGAPPP